MAAPVAVAAPTTTLPTTTMTTRTTTPADLGPVQRIPLQVDGKIVGTALVRSSADCTAALAAVAFRSQVLRLLLVGGALGALPSLALGIVFARRAT